MRIVVIGATGNVGSALVRTLVDEGHEVVGAARRLPEEDLYGAQWQQLDITSDDLVPVLRGADAVVHLAWMIQPTRDLGVLRGVNVDGTSRLLDAIVEAGVPALVYASSIGAYSPRKGPYPVDESWPTHGVASSSYSRQKAYVERMLDAFEAANPDVRVVRLRPALIFQPESASEQRRLFAGALLPRTLLRPGVLPVVPRLTNVTFQAVHADDIADAYRRAVVSDERGAFNVATDDVLTTADVADLLEARSFPFPWRIARAAATATWRLRLHPLSPGWLDMARWAPLLDSSRVRSVLGWEPQHSGKEALRAILRGIARGTGEATPTLKADREDRDVADELRTRQGAEYSTDPETEVSRV